MSVEDPRDGHLSEFFPGYEPPPPPPKAHLEVGLYADVSHEDYHADPCARPSLSSGVARMIVDESPLHAHLIHPRLGAAGGKNSRVFDRGTMLHLLLLGKGQDFVEIEADNYKKAWAQQQRDAAYADKRVPVLSRELEEYNRIVKIFREKLAATVDDAGQPDPVVFDGESELTGIWEEPIAGAADAGPVACRLRADHWRPQRLEILDVKTTVKSVSPRSIARQLYDNGADVQHAHYTAGMSSLVDGAQGRVRMRYLFLEVNPPHDVVVIEPNGEYRELGRRRWSRALRRWAACLGADAWPGHSGGRTLRISPPKYAVNDDAEADMAAMGPPSRPDF
ncbi:MAG: hypothetical protein V4537_14385 [Pseudomonadota bacterium]